MEALASRAERRRLAVLTSGTKIPAWQLAALRGLLEEKVVELSLVIDASDSHASARSGEREPRAAPLPANPMRIVSAASELRGVPRLTCDESLGREIVARRIDLVWCACAFSLPPDLPSAVPGGAWALDIDNGDASCVNALLRADPVIEARLLRLESTTGEARVLARAHFLNEPFAPASTRARVLYGCAMLPARQLRAWHLQGERALDGERIRLRPSRHSNWIAHATIPMHQLVSIGRRAYSACRSDHWAVGISQQPIAAFLTRDRPPDITWITERAGDRYYADPFGFETPDGAVLLAERYDRHLRIGRIDALNLHSNGKVAIRHDVLATSCHLSYPYLIRDGQEVYCVPESHERRRVDLYRGTPFPEHWTFAATLLDDFAGVDPTVFRHDGLWWLLCCSHDDEPYANLYGFFAETLTGPWRPHPLNPLKRDPRSARPAGTPFQHAGTLYRPAQDCSAGYGRAIVINRIHALSPTTFSEEPVRRVAPDPEGPYPDGLHTLSEVGGRTVIDGMRLDFSFEAALKAGRHFLRKLYRSRVGGSGASRRPVVTT